MNWKKRIVIAGASLGMLIVSGTMLNAQEVERSVLGAGGTEMNGGGLKVVGTFGQPMAGSVQSGNVVVGQGFWYVPKATGTSGVKEERAEAIAAGMGLTTWPNPMTSTGTVNIRLPRGGETNLILYDALGREVRRLLEGNTSGGETSVQLNGADLEAGRYTLLLESNGLRLTEALIVVQ